MSSLFDYLPSTTYNNIKGVNILREAVVVQQYLNNYRTFYAYTVKDGERPDIIAYKEYADPTLDWVILLLNGIVDPYKDWVLDTNQFKSYLEAKYNLPTFKLSSISDASTIAYYYYEGLTTDDPSDIASKNYNMTYTTYIKLGRPAGWVAKSIYDYENEINESKRDIKLLKPQYISSFKQQVKDVFNG
jgi:hypothetical protein